MTPAPATSPSGATPSGAQPREGARAVRVQPAPAAHWTAAMDRAAREGDAPAAGEVISPETAAKKLGRLKDVTGKTFDDAAPREKSARAGGPDDAAAGTGGHAADQPARLHAAHAGEASNPLAFVNLLLASGHACPAPPPSAASAVTNPGGEPAVKLAGHRDAAAPPEVTAPLPSLAANIGHEAARARAPHDAANPDQSEPAALPATDTGAQADGGAMSAHGPAPALPDAASAGRAAAGRSDAVPSAGADRQAGSASADLPPPAALATMTAAPAHGDSTGSATSNNDAKPAGADARTKLAEAEPGHQIAAQASPPASRASAAPAAGMPSAWPGPVGPAGGPAGPAAGQAATPSPTPSPTPFAGDAAVPATPSALAAAVLAMQKAGEHSTVLRLDPAGLGAMTVHVSMDQRAQVNVQFAPSLTQTAHLLTSNLDELRQAMSAAGIALGQTSVSSDGGHPGGDAGGRSGQPSRPESAGRSSLAVQGPSTTGGAEHRSGGVRAYA